MIKADMNKDRATQLLEGIAITNEIVFKELYIEPIDRWFDIDDVIGKFSSDFFHKKENFLISCSWLTESNNKIYIFDYNKPPKEKIIFSKEIREIVYVEEDGEMQKLSDVIEYIGKAVAIALAKVMPKTITISSIDESLSDFDSIDFEDL